MKISLANLLAPMAAFVQLAQANFDVYAVDTTFSWGGPVSNNWQIFDTDPSCSQVNNALIFGSYGDVSSTVGVRCAGDCRKDSHPRDIRILEMHFRKNPKYHWSESSSF